MEEEHDELADALESDADDMQEEGDRLKQDIDETREDWQSKQHSDDAPGAQPPDESDA
jgi:cell division septum initiation protein DivIVA